jgi:hypothetical protein
VRRDQHDANRPRGEQQRRHHRAVAIHALKQERQRDKGDPWLTNEASEVSAARVKRPFLNITGGSNGDLRRRIRQIKARALISARSPQPMACD